MKKRSSARRSDTRAKFFLAAFCLALGWSAAAVVPADSTLGATWRFRLESFGPFASTVRQTADDRPLCYLDASGRRVAPNETTIPRSETEPTFGDESAELWANAETLETTPNGATFAETEAEAEMKTTPVSFASADLEFDAESEIESDAETSSARFSNADWIVVDENAQERDNWSRELRLVAFSEPTFAESSAPTWRDAVAIETATLDELRALEFEPGAVPSSLVSSSLRRRSANARLHSGDYSFAETSNVSDANAPRTTVASTPASTSQISTAAPTRVGAFAACGAFESDGGARVRVQ